MSVEVETDADTGDEILYFERRYRTREGVVVYPYLYLRDKDTKRFIRRLIGVELRFYMVVDYSEERASKGNPLYVDAVAVIALKPETFLERDAQEDIAESLCSGKVAELFGAYVEAEILDTAGVEYGSEVRTELREVEVIIRRKRIIKRETVNERVYFWSVVWTHHKGESPRSEQGVDVR